MSVKVAKNRFIVSSLIQGESHIINSVSSFQELGVKLVQEIETARVFRQIQRIEDLSLILCNVPIREYQLIGQYYYALSSFLRGDDTQDIFETVLEESKTFKARALITLAGIEARKGNTEAELNYFAKAAKHAHSPSLLIEINRGTAIVKAKEGWHGQAFKELEDIYPLIRHTDFYTQCQYFNSLAVELCETGRLEEARNISRIVLASPFIFAYPEWRETGQEIAGRGCPARRQVSVEYKPPPSNVRFLPDPEPGPVHAAYWGQLYSFAERKKMVEEANGRDEDIDKMDDRDLILKLLELAAYDGVDEKKLRKIVKYAAKVMSEKD